MSFDSGAAWDDAIKMVKSNKDVLAIVASVFFFLPALAQAILMQSESSANEPENLDQIIQLMLSELSSNWYIIIPVYLVIYVGSVAVHALLGKAQPPTVGEALSLGVKMLPSYLAYTVVIFTGLALVCAPLLLIKTGTGLGLVGVLTTLVLLVVFLVVTIRLSLVAAVFGIEETANPMTAMQRSWSLIKGKTASIFVFLILISIAAGIILAITGWAVGLLASATGPVFSIWVAAILNGLIGSAFSVLMLAVYTAIYLQLTGAKGAEAFE